MAFIKIYDLFFYTTPLHLHNFIFLAQPAVRTLKCATQQQPNTCSKAGYQIQIMPKDSSIKSVLIIGSGPIIIGQACEFDYSGTQAARSLREEGIEVILINSNPATIMTDPMMADKVYLLPLTPESIESILAENKIDAVLPTMGGQTALNLCKEVDELGIWGKYNCRMIGVDVEAIDTAEDREKFRQLMMKIGVAVAPSHVANSFLEGKEFAQQINYQIV